MNANQYVALWSLQKKQWAKYLVATDTWEFTANLKELQIWDYWSDFCQEHKTGLYKTRTMIKELEVKSLSPSEIITIKVVWENH